eukprot:306891-Chlamydomonas_euryale.AAC.1
MVPHQRSRTDDLRHCVHSHVALQIVKKRLAVAVPMLQCGEFFYEEGEGLEDDEVAMYQVSSHGLGGVG